MGWIILMFIWAAMSAMATFPCVNEIENLENERDKVFSYIIFAVAGPMIILSGFAVGALEKLGISFEDDDNDNTPWKRY